MTFKHSLKSHLSLFVSSDGGDGPAVNSAIREKLNQLELPNESPSRVVAIYLYNETLHVTVKI